MFEHRSQPVLSRHAFFKRIALAFFITLLLVGGSLLVGTVGYHQLGDRELDEAFYHTCLMLSGHDVHPSESTPGGRIFSGVFILYARLIFVSTVAILFVPVLHRILHKLHFEENPQGLSDQDDAES
ncbi:MAG: hypothetical protein P1U68_06265 [Verrucomicrobiales bacterium]|nr:hypothetical protein [Verrucomicrobiales bacterium]